MIPQFAAALVLGLGGILVPLWLTRSWPWLGEYGHSGCMEWAELPWWDEE